MRTLSFEDYILIDPNAAERPFVCEHAQDEPVLVIETDYHLYRFSCQAVNKRADRIQVEKSITEFNTDPVLVWIYHEDPSGNRVYSCPAFFEIGRGNPHGVGYIPNYDWCKQIKEAGISKEIICTIARYLDSHVPPD